MRRYIHMLLFLIHAGCSTPGTGGGDSPEDTAPADAGEPPVPLEIRIAFEETSVDYSVTAAFDGGVLRAYCGGADSEEDPGITCEAYGARLLEVSGDEVHLTVKARGCEFVSETVTMADLEAVDDIWVHNVTLSPLETFEVEEDYRTGFGADDLEAFEEMGYPSTTEMGAALAVKFIIADLETRPVVYFQNTRRNPIHYDFVRTVLGVNISSAEFWEAAYSGEDREYLAGTVMRYEAVDSECPRLGSVSRPIAVTFFPSDDLTVEQARFAQRLIEERLGFSPLTGAADRVFYLPAGDQQESALLEETALFEAWDAGWVLRREIFRRGAVQLMNPGVAYGTLRLADRVALEGEVFSFRDIVILPVLPVALPIVGGTITEEFQTPLAHVNIMARNRGTPNITLPGAATDPEVVALIGKLVRFEVTDESYRLEESTLDEAEAFWASSSREPILLESDMTFEGLPLLSEIGFDDWVRVGAKAANLAELSELLGPQAPYGFAVPFCYYSRAMDRAPVETLMCDAARVDCRSGERTEAICDRAGDRCSAAIGSRLSEYVDALLKDDDFVSDTPLREALLAGLRYLIAHMEIERSFADDLDARVAEVFGAARVRLRSSTNTEDIPGFSGAGLYDSASAYAEGAERASEIIRGVWASVWNWRAFEERSFWNIDHRSTRMGVLVNQAFGEEAANGVLITQNIADMTVAGMYVNVQVGEISVTNPEGTAVPEIFSIIPGAEPGTVQAARLGYSSLSPEEPIMTDEEIETLYRSAGAVQRHFAALYDKHPTLLAMDLEFKLLAGDRALMIKQARPYTY